MNSNKIFTLYGSSRKGGNTEYLADKLTHGLDDTKIYLEGEQLKPIIDQRHDGVGFNKVNDDYEAILDEFLNHDTYIFVTPLYWFSMSAQMKIFFDRWSQYKDDPLWNFKERIKGKSVYLITVANDEPIEEVIKPMVDQFRLICNYVNLDFKGYIAGKGSKPKEVKLDIEALEKIESLRRTLMQ